MIKKIMVATLVISTSFLTGYAAAQSFLKKTPNEAPAATGNSVENVMTPSDFQGEVQKRQHQKNNALDSQLKQNLSKIPPVAPPSQTKSGQGPDFGSSPPTTTKKDANGLPLAEPNYSQPVPPQTPAAPQADVYSGFQTPSTNSNQNQNQNQNQSPPASGGGWNIKY